MSTERIKLISLNIERDLHYKTALPFLKAEAADVVCLMELLDRDVERFEEELGMKGLYISIAKADRGRHTEKLAQLGVESGNAIFTKLSKEKENVFYYYGTADAVPSITDPLPAGRYDHSRGVFLSAQVVKGDTRYTVGTTHFTWTPDGSASETQRQEMRKLLDILSSFPDIVFCGDFNAPRGGEIWEMMASRYKDNIPPQYETSIDQNLHVVKGIMHLVDGLFSTPHYRCTDTRLQCGVSDHCAIVSTIERLPLGELGN